LAVKIRLTRMGRKKRPYYRIVVADSRAPRDGRYIERVGRYDPLYDPPEIDVDEDRVNYWLDNGAIPTETVMSILKHQGIIYKRYLRKKGYDEAAIEEEMKKWEALQVQRQKRKEEKALKEKERKAKVEKEPEVEKELEVEKEPEVEEKPAAEKEKVEEGENKEAIEKGEEEKKAGDNEDADDKQKKDEQ